MGNPGNSGRSIVYTLFSPAPAPGPGGWLPVPEHQKVACAIPSTIAHQRPGTPISLLPLNASPGPHSRYTRPFDPHHPSPVTVKEGCLEFRNDWRNARNCICDGNAHHAPDSCPCRSSRQTACFLTGTCEPLVLTYCTACGAKSSSLLPLDSRTQSVSLARANKFTRMGRQKHVLHGLGTAESHIIESRCALSTSFQYLTGVLSVAGRFSWSQGWSMSASSIPGPD